MEPAQESIKDLLYKITKVIDGQQIGLVYLTFAGLIGVNAASSKLSAKAFADLKQWFVDEIDSAYEEYYRKKRKEAGIDD